MKNELTIARADRDRAMLQLANTLREASPETDWMKLLNEVACAPEPLLEREWPMTEILAAAEKHRRTSPLGAEPFAFELVWIFERAVQIVRVKEWNAWKQAHEQAS